MRLIIKPGESIDTALQYLQAFLDQYKDKYLMLQTGMNIYVNLEGFGHRVCPDNDKTFILSEDGFVDLLQKEIADKRKLTLDAWNWYQEQAQRKYMHAQKAVELDEEALQSAINRNLKPRTIEQREYQLECSKKRLLQEECDYALAELLAICVEKGAFEWRFNRKVLSQKPYNYAIEAYMVFSDVDGEDWYFSPQITKYDMPFGNVCQGKPIISDPVKENVENLSQND